MDNHYEKYNKEGYIVIDDFLDEEIALELYDIFSFNNSWEKIDQVREKHYQHVFSTDSLNLPRKDEVYLAKFNRSKKIENDSRILEIYKNEFLPKLLHFSKNKLSEFELRCYSMQHGDFMRSHIDDYIGEIGCIYYINKRWIWDWGGLLHVNFYGNDFDFVETIFPKFNRIVLLNHNKFKFPHFVSAISEYAKECRLTLISFNK